ncbi:MAG: hypothetical protein K6L76_06260 [Agarilytica sp.]
MNKLIVGILVMFVSTSLHASEKVNSRESLRICKSALTQDAGETMELKFKRKTATSVEAKKFKHWFNIVEIHNGEKSSKKLRCETSRTGELLVIHSEPGKWNI